MTPKLWSISGLAVEFGLDRRTVASRLANVHPAQGEGRSARYRLADAAGAVFGSAGGGRAGETAPGEPLDLNTERARLTKAQADKTELEVAVLRGEQIPAETVAASWQDQVMAARARLLSFPATVAPLVVGLSLREAEVELRDRIYEVLEELKDYDPADYRPRRGREAEQADGEAVGAAAQADRQRVGRHTSDAQPRRKRGARPVAD